MERSNTMQVPVWSDVMCPFCYIGKRHFEKALAQFTDKEHISGLEYHLDKTAMVNSFKAHRLIQMAKEKGLGDKAKELAFYANFTQNKDFSSAEKAYAEWKQTHQPIQ